MIFWVLIHRPWQILSNFCKEVAKWLDFGRVKHECCLITRQERNSWNKSAFAFPNVSFDWFEEEFDFIWITGALATLRVSFDWFDEDLIQYEIRCIHISYCFIWLTWGGFVSRWNICAFASPIVFIWLIWGRFDFIWNIGAYPLPTISFDLLEEDLVYTKYRSICISYCFIWLIWGGFVSMWNIVADWLEKELFLWEL